MKIFSLIISLFVLLFCQYGYSVERITKDDEKIDIVEEPKINPKEDRSIRNLECYLNRSENIIEVKYYGIGTPVVYVLDEYGNIVSCNSGILNKVIVYVPTVEGLYQILVQSDTYSGVGEFYIF